MQPPTSLSNENTPNIITMELGNIITKLANQSRLTEQEINFVELEIGSDPICTICEDVCELYIDSEMDDEYLLACRDCGRSDSVYYFENGRKHELCEREPTDAMIEDYAEMLGANYAEVYFEARDESERMMWI